MAVTPNTLGNKSLSIRRLQLNQHSLSHRLKCQLGSATTTSLLNATTSNRRWIKRHSPIVSRMGRGCGCDDFHVHPITAGDCSLIRLRLPDLSITAGIKEAAWAHLFGALSKKSLEIFRIGNCCRTICTHPCNHKRVFEYGPLLERSWIIVSLDSSRTTKMTIRK